MRRIAAAIGVVACAFGLLPAAASAAFGPVSSFGSSGSGNGFFNHPQAAAVNFGNGNVYVADTGQGLIQVFNSNGVFKNSFQGAAGFSPQDVAVDPTSGNVYVASPHKIEGFTSGGVPIPLVSWAPAGTAAGIAVDSNGDVWESDLTDSQLHKYGPLGQDKGAFSGLGTSAGQLAQPRGLTWAQTASTNLIYVADPSNNRVEAFNLDGSYAAQWTMPSYTVNTSHGSFSGVVHPQDVAVDPTGRVFAPDSGVHSNLVAAFDASGNLQQLFGAPDSDPNNACKVVSPWGVATSPSGNLYVVSTGENTVRVFNESSSACPAPNFGQPGGGGGGGGNGGGSGAAGATGNGRPQVTFTGFPARRCVRRDFTFQIHLYDVDRIAQMDILVNRRRVARQRPNEQSWNVKVHMPVRALRRAAAGRSLKIGITVRATDLAGGSSTLSRAFRVCR